jgi:hypothetical protein
VGIVDVILKRRNRRMKWKHYYKTYPQSTKYSTKIPSKMAQLHLGGM